MFGFLIMVMLISLNDLVWTTIKLFTLSKYEKTKRMALYFQLPLSSIIFVWGTTLLIGLI